MAQKKNEGNEKNKKPKGASNGINFKVVQLKCHIKVEKASFLNGSDEPANIIINTNPNDPLFTPQIEVKVELNDENPSYQTENNNSDNDCNIEKYEFDDNEHEIGKEMRPSPNDSEYELSQAESFETIDDEDNEPLALLKEISESKRRRKENGELFSLSKCLDTCKYKCKTKFSKCQRRDIFAYYRQLNEEEKLNFLRHHIRKPILTRICNQRDRGRNCSYFLKPYKIGTTHFAKQPEEENLIDCKSLNLTKICRKFFEATLGIAPQEIRDAIEGYELQLAKIVRSVDNIKKEDQSYLSENISDKSANPQKFLDPQTGNLCDTKPRIRTKRRKKGEPAPERFPQPINCFIRCTFKCHQNFNENERKQICDTFWSLDFKGRKDFILAHMQAKDVESPTSTEYRKSNRVLRAYQSRFFLSSPLKGEKKRVCKHFLLNTLCINHNSIANAIKYADKTTGRYTGVDGRCKRAVTRKSKIPTERKDKVSNERRQEAIDHINSYPVWAPNKNSEERLLHQSLSIKRIYKNYREQCLILHKNPVSKEYFYKIFRKEFRLQFLYNTESKRGCSFLSKNPTISQYTGEEPGGCWLDSRGNEIDIKLFKPYKSLKFQSLSDAPEISDPFAHFGHFLNPSTAIDAQNPGSFVGNSTNFKTSTLSN